MKARKILVSVAALALVAAISIGGTLAYLTANKTVKNTFTMGKVDIDLTEEKWVEPETVQPGLTYEKNPVVKNTGKNDAYVRVTVCIQPGMSMLNLVEIVNKHDFASLFNGLSDKWTASDEKAVIGLAGSLHENCWYVTFTYKDVLKPGESTDELFKSVTFPGYLSSKDIESLGEGFDIAVRAEAIQADGFTDTIGDDGVTVVKTAMQNAWEAFDAQK